MFALPARKKNLHLDLEVAAEVPGLVLGDPERLAQVLINLIGNAIKFTHEGEVHVRVQPSGASLEFSVIDTGIGIPEEKRGMLFKSFSQTDASFARHYGGTGLGLAISKGLVELMGGQISVRAREEKGSTFSFTLPLKAVDQPPIPSAETSPQDPGKSTAAARILLAEDDPLIREMITMMLAQKGVKVSIAETGTEAVEKWEVGHFDLIFMDLEMPEMNGLEATRAIRNRENGRGKHTSIIGLTGHALGEVIADCLNAGMDQVLTKPFQMQDLYSAVQTCITE